MISCIRFYPFAETIEYFKSEHTLLRNIELDNIHKTRIILQDIEKNNLREVFMNFNNR